MKKDLDDINILVVDDDDILRQMLEKGVSIAGYNCFLAENADKALLVLDTNAIDVVITDISMPGMNGIELTKIIKTKHNSDVIVMTGYTGKYEYVDIIRMGARDFIRKPVGVKEFIARLKRVLKERETLYELNRTLDKFQKATSGIVQVLSRTVEMRDPYTAGHQDIVAELACAIAAELELSPERIYGLRMAGLLHDIGKICIPSEILSKPRRLSEPEFAMIKHHPQVATDILKDIDFPWPLAQIIYQHHERMDGSGYPQGLYGNQILLEARILAVADVFETIASHRPYRPALGIDKAISELELNSGKLYDPDVVSACLKLVEKGVFNFLDTESTRAAV